MTGCGDISVGGGTGSNDPRPTGRVLYQGQFSSQNGKSVSGTALIFYSTTAGSYTIRLEGLTAPSETLQVTVFASPGGQVATFPLRSSSGSMNYTYSGGTAGMVFNSVNIYSSQYAINYGTAQLFAQF